MEHAAALHRSWAPKISITTLKNTDLNLTHSWKDLLEGCILPWMILQPIMVIILDGNRIFHGCRHNRKPWSKFVSSRNRHLASPEVTQVATQST
jgi:hypothetical protein